MNEQIGRGSHSAVLLTWEQLDPAERQSLMECLGDPVTSWRTIPAEQEQSGNLQSMKSCGIEDVMADALQFPMNGVRCGDSSRPVRPGLQGSDLLGGRLDDVAEEKQQGFLAFPGIQQAFAWFC